MLCERPIAESCEEKPTEVVHKAILRLVASGVRNAARHDPAVSEPFQAFPQYNQLMST